MTIADGLGEKIAGIKEDTGEMTNTLYSLSIQINLFFLAQVLSLERKCCVNLVKSRGFFMALYKYKRRRLDTASGQYLVPTGAWLLHSPCIVVLPTIICTALNNGIMCDREKMLPKPIVRPPLAH